MKTNPRRGDVVSALLFVTLLIAVILCTTTTALFSESTPRVLGINTATATAAVRIPHINIADFFNTTLVSISSPEAAQLKSVFLTFTSPGHITLPHDMTLIATTGEDDVVSFPPQEMDFSNTLTDMLATVTLNFNEGGNGTATVTPMPTTVTITFTNNTDATNPITLFTHDITTTIQPPLFTPTVASHIRPMDVYNDILYLQPTTYTSLGAESLSTVGAYWKNVWTRAEFPTEFNFTLIGTATFTSSGSSTSSRYCSFNGVDALVKLINDQQIVVSTPAANKLYIAPTHFINIKCTIARGYGVKYVVNTAVQQEHVVITATKRAIAGAAGDTGLAIDMATTHNFYGAKMNSAVISTETPAVQFLAGQKRWRKADGYFSCAHGVSYRESRSYKLPFEVQAAVGGATPKANIASINRNYMYQVLTFEGDFTHDYIRALQHNHILPVHMGDAANNVTALGRTPAVIAVKGFDANTGHNTKVYSPLQVFPVNMMMDLNHFDLEEEGHLQCSILIKKYSTTLPTDQAAPVPEFTFTLYTTTFPIFTPKSRPEQIKALEPKGTNGIEIRRQFTTRTGKSGSYKAKHWLSLKVTNKNHLALDRVTVFSPYLNGRFFLDNNNSPDINTQNHIFKPTITNNFVSWSIENIGANADPLNPYKLDTNVESFTLRSKSIRWIKNIALIETKRSHYPKKFVMQSVEDDATSNTQFTTTSTTTSSSSKKDKTKFDKTMYSFDWRASMKGYYTAPFETITRYQTLRIASQSQTDTESTPVVVAYNSRFAFSAFSPSEDVTLTAGAEIAAAEFNELYMNKVIAQDFSAEEVYDDDDEYDYNLQQYDEQNAEEQEQEEDSLEGPEFPDFELPFLNRLALTLDDWLGYEGELAEFFYPTQDDPIVPRDEDDDAENTASFDIQQSGTIFVSPKKTRGVKMIDKKEYFHHNSYCQIVAYANGEAVGIRELRQTWKPLESWELGLAIGLPVGVFVVGIATLVLSLIFCC